MVLPEPLFQLVPSINEYAWGKRGRTSKAAVYASATSELSFQPADETPYAELWMGTHPSGPSTLAAAPSTTLASALSDNAALSGPTISEAYDGHLPFLLKVLSIEKALSIQAHPTKALAAQLHKNDPKNYKDDNHKPEMAIALTPFDGFCGFRPVEEIAGFCGSVRALRALIGESECDRFISAVSGSNDVEANRAALKTLYTTLMRKSEAEVGRHAVSLVDEARGRGSSFAGGQPLGGRALGELVVRLDSQFPKDVGLFSTFFLNYVKLAPGEAMFLKALDAHAYLSGDIVECMAASDNVIRAGFTPKFKDVDVLTQNLTYAYAPAAAQKMQPTSWSKSTPSSDTVKTLLYDPPIDEFAVAVTTLQNKNDKDVHEPVDGPSIVIVTSGTVLLSLRESSSHTVSEGQVYFVGAGATLHLENAGSDEAVLFRAFVEIADDKPRL
ncbi:Mannose-6-phosphate isomerase [Savitreella phatthalungensis]